MKATTTKLLTVSLAIAAAIALPTAVKAESSNLSETTLANSTSSERINTEYNDCWYVPGFPPNWCDFW
ncbi:MAG: hypothetical protein AAGC93_18855 [Cyanobacteria bacterium P01_F01_bin.53]